MEDRSRWTSADYRRAHVAAGRCGCGREREDAERRTCQRCRDSSKRRAVRRPGTGRPRGRPRKADHEKAPRRATTGYYRAYRDQVLEHYGKACSCCGETERAFLAIDHAPGTPRTAEQKNLTQWLIRNDFPPGFRTLCHNCNMATRWGRDCPHKQAA